MPGPTATASTSTIILDPSNPSHKTLFPTALADVHIACISTDKTIATFLPPLSRSKIAKWYEDRFREVESGSRVMVMEWLPSSFASAPDSTPTIEGKEEEQEVVTWEGRELAGSVMLATRRGPDGELTTQTGPFRGDVLNLLVSPRFRRRGVARRIMERLEVEARRVGVGLLMLDTEVGSPAEMVYPRLGYTAVGTIPKYGFSPVDNKTLKDELFFYKDLRKHDD